MRGYVTEYEREFLMESLSYKTKKPYNYSEADEECALEEDDHDRTPSSNYAA